jgi:myo-inositol-1(or 4)-monophosphatase
MKRLLYTWENEPSYLNGEKISVKKGGFEKGEYVFGIPYWDRNFDTNKYIDLIWEKDIRVTYVESIVYESMMVALGISKALIIIAASPWDRAAGKMIIENAGGRCTDENGNRLPVFGNPRFFVATNGTVHDEALNILQQCINR